MKFLKLAFLTSLLALTACQSTPPVPEPRYIPNVVLADSVVLEVMPYRMPCNSSSPMQCLIVKPVDAPDDKTFGIAYNGIVGFDAKVGITYKIKVRQEIDQNTGTPTGQWQLQEILNQIVR